MKRPLQIGERVAVYYNESPNRYVGTITGVSDTYIDFKTDYGALYGAHIKQCRRLKPKKKPREWNLLLCKDGSWGTIHPGKIKTDKVGNKYELVRVREVLE